MAAKKNNSAVCKCESQPLRPSALGIASALVWGGAIFLCTLFSYFTGNGYGVQGASLLASIYPGYSISPMGAIGGLLYGLIDGFVFGALIAWVYNKFK